MIYLKSLWNLLSFRRVLLLTYHGQDAIDQLDEKYKENIKLDRANDDKEIKNIILSGKQCVSIINLFNILLNLYKFIVYKLTSSTLNRSNQEEEEEKFNIEMEINDLLSLLETYSQDEEHEASVNLNEYNLKSIKLKNIYHVWKLFVSIYFENLKA